MNNDNVMTVGELRRMLENVPDTTELWMFNSNQSTFTPVVSTTHDKRVNGFNLWVEDTND